MHADLVFEEILFVIKRQNHKTGVCCKGCARAKNRTTGNDAGAKHAYDVLRANAAAVPSTVWHTHVASCSSVTKLAAWW